MQIVLPMVFMFVMGFVFCLLVNPYIRKLFHEKTDHEVEKENLLNQIKQLKKQVREYEKQTKSTS